MTSASDTPEITTLLKAQNRALRSEIASLVEDIRGSDRSAKQLPEIRQKRLRAGPARWCQLVALIEQRVASVRAA
jgi:hypothetical protein